MNDFEAQEKKLKQKLSEDETLKLKNSFHNGIEQPFIEQITHLRDTIKQMDVKYLSRLNHAKKIEKELLEKQQRLVYERNFMQDRLQMVEEENEKLKRDFRIERNLRKDFENDFNALLPELEKLNQKLQDQLNKEKELKKIEEENAALRLEVQAWHQKLREIQEVESCRINSLMSPRDPDGNAIVQEQIRINQQLLFEQVRLQKEVESLLMEKELLTAYIEEEKSDIDQEQKRLDKKKSKLTQIHDALHHKNSMSTLLQAAHASQASEDRSEERRDESSDKRETTRSHSFKNLRSFWKNVVLTGDKKDIDKKDAPKSTK